MEPTTYNTRTLRQLKRFQGLNNIDSPSEFIIDFFAAMLEDKVQVPQAEPIQKGHLAFAMLAGVVSIRRRLFTTCKGHLGIYLPLAWLYAYSNHHQLPFSPPAPPDGRL